MISSDADTHKAKPKVKFLPHEDKMIEEWVKIHGPEKWRELSKRIPGRSSRALRERYVNYLDPSVNHSQWSPEEDQLLLDLYNRFNSQWSKMAQYLPGRTDISIKNRYARLSRRAQIKSPPIQRHVRQVLPSITQLPFVCDQTQPFLLPIFPIPS